MDPHVLHDSDWNSINVSSIQSSDSFELNLQSINIFDTENIDNEDERQDIYSVSAENKVEEIHSFSNFSNQNTVESIQNHSVHELNDQTVHIESILMNKTDDLVANTFESNKPDCVESIHLEKSTNISLDGLNPRRIEIYRRLGDAIVESLHSMKVKDRRSLMAFAPMAGLTKKDMEYVMGTIIHSNEWSAVRKHTKIPGPGYPPLHFFPNFRKRVDDEITRNFLLWLHGSDLLQSLSYGHKVVKYDNGFHVMVEAVKTNENHTDIIRKYFDVFLEERRDSGVQDVQVINQQDRSGDDGFCDKQCRKTRTRCLLEVEHQGRHAFTPEHMISQTTLHTILKQLTSGQIKSLIGLDDTYVSCGYENFNNMTAWVRNISCAAEVLGQADKHAFDDLIMRINKTASFHKAGFAQHLGAGDKMHTCCCFECGFYHRKDSIRCIIHNDNGNSSPCMECFDAFKVIDDMHSLHHTYDELFRRNGIYGNQPLLEDDMANWHADLDEFKQKMIKYRAHVAQKEDEAIFDANFLASVGAGDVIVVADYKMKILSSLYREKQVDWFSKSGFSCLGVMIRFGADPEFEENEVEYHFFISDDTKQDSEAVNIVKEIKGVHFRADGASNFSNISTKGLIANWGIERTCKTSVAGCGKTALDGMFGVLTQHLTRLVDKGHSFKTASELWDLLNEYPLNFSYFHLFKPNRIESTHVKIVDEAKEKYKGIADAYYLLVSEEGGSVRGYRHSRHGDGVILPMLQAEDPPQNFRSDEYSKNLIKMHILRSVLIDCPEICLENRRSLHTKTPWKVRRAEFQQNYIFQANETVRKKVLSDVEKLEEAGLYPCTVTNAEYARCTKVFCSNRLRSIHETNGTHDYPKPSLYSAVLTDARSGRYSLCIDCGAFTNRDSAVAQEYVIQPGPLQSNSNRSSGTSDDKLFKFVDFDECFQKGCYQKEYSHSKSERFKASPKLIEELEKLFLKGENDNNKYTAEEALEQLKNMTLDTGRRVFGRNKNVNLGGNLPRVDYIKSWFSIRKSNQRKGKAKVIDDFSLLSVEELKERFLERFGICSYEAKLLEVDDLMKQGRISREWEELSSNQLKDELQKRELPLTRYSKGGLLKILRYYETLND